MGIKTQLRRLFRGETAHGGPTAIAPAPETAESVAARFPDVPAAHVATYLAVKDLTMTSPERLFGLCQAVDHVLRTGIPGDFVECGVWRGGSSVAMIRSLQQAGCATRDLWLYDTFTGMSPPTDHDVDCFGNSAEQLLVRDQHDRVTAASVWCEASLEDVQQQVGRTAYPTQRLHFVRGKVEDTIPQQVPAQIALLRLDTDWFESTWHELVHLYPRLAPGGVLIIDDYGHWQGCRQAVDQYLAQYAPNLFLHRLDYTGRLAIKPESRSASATSVGLPT